MARTGPSPYTTRERRVPSSRFRGRTRRTRDISLVRPAPTRGRLCDVGHLGDARSRGGEPAAGGRGRASRAPARRPRRSRHPRRHTARRDPTAPARQWARATHGPQIALARAMSRGSSREEQPAVAPPLVGAPRVALDHLAAYEHLGVHIPVESGPALVMQESCGLSPDRAVAEPFGGVGAAQLAGAAQVLEVGVGLAVGHRAPRPRARTGASTAPAPEPGGRARCGRRAQQVEALVVVLAGSPWPARRGRRTGGRGPAARS